MSGLYWLASYPKSGNTWVRCFLSALAGGGVIERFDEIVQAAHASASRPWLEAMLDVPSSDFSAADFIHARADLHRMQAATVELSRILKVHDCYDPALFPAAVTAGVVYIVRDPRDVVPSLAAHLGKSLDQAIASMSDDHFRLAARPGVYFPQGPQWLSSWSRHAESWLVPRQAPVLLLRYEDLCADPALQFRRLLDFVGLSCDEAAMQGALRATRFEALRAKEARDGFPERSRFAARFFRQGTAGAWRQALDPEQAARVQAQHGPMMRQLGYL